MTDEHFDQAFERMQTELNVTPSPEFVVKVRQQNEQMPARSSWNLWAWAGAAATCAAAVIAGTIWRGQAPEPQTQALRNPAPSSAAHNVVGSGQVSVQPGDQSNRGTVPAVARPRASRAGGTPAPAIVATSATTELEVLVPPDQLIGIRQLMASVRKGAGVQVAPPATLIDPATGELITPKPIEIPLITVTPLPGDPEGRSGGRQNR